ncbi:aminodeoxychorismate lyase [Alcanivorax sp. S6407]|uniref:aminodeoxychorismate lyase n=1 Tax=Alcanivorax sp. S6407 TaxID=2926424 RepID=UPI001FF36F9B|nr:aminodeoxychorismate lyase [Alcanivorax sp. S6407]MCK0155415.1 aminodeoxychorismate lyase [Alcanivorax sp. S6407]
MIQRQPAFIDSRDRGLAYGDGLFETLRVAADGRIPLLSLHRQRMLDGARALGIPAPQPVEIEQALQKALAQKPGPGLIKLILTRGVGGRGYLPPANPVPSLLWQTGDLPVWDKCSRQEGIVMGLCSQPLQADPFPGYKHLNRLAQVQARAEVARQGWQEGLLLSPRRQPLEATAMNLFARFEEGWWTPDLAAARSGVAGVMRQWLLDDLTRRGEGVSCDLRPLSQLRHAQGLFLANSVVGVLPVRKLAQWQWQVPPEVRNLQARVDAIFDA